MPVNVILFVIIVLKFFKISFSFFVLFEFLITIRIQLHYKVKALFGPCVILISPISEKWWITSYANTPFAALCNSSEKSDLPPNGTCPITTGILPFILLCGDSNSAWNYSETIFKKKFTSSIVCCCFFKLKNMWQKGIQTNFY